MFATTCPMNPESHWHARDPATEIPHMPWDEQSAELEQESEQTDSKKPMLVVRSERGRQTATSPRATARDCLRPAPGTCNTGRPPPVG
jgi:hypothetical protein